MYVWLENGSTTTFCSSRMVEIEPVIPHCRSSAQVVHVHVQSSAEEYIKHREYTTCEEAYER